MDVYTTLCKKGRVHNGLFTPSDDYCLRKLVLGGNVLCRSCSEPEHRGATSIS